MIHRERMDADCRESGIIIYQIECTEDGCKKKYVGQTVWSLYKRMREHNAYSQTERMIANQLQDTTMSNMREIKFKEKVVGNMYIRQNKRRIGEAVYIGQ